MSHNLPEYTFTSTAIRQGGHWFVHCDQHPAVCTKVRLLHQALPLQRHGIATLVGLPESDITVEIRPVLPVAVHEHLARARELRGTAAWANKAAALEARAAARILADARLSLRDIGTILGVSHQRVHQLIRAHAR